MNSVLVCTSIYCEKKNVWVPTVQPDTTWKQGTLFIRIVKCAYLPCQGRFKTPVMFAELNLARPDVLVLSSSCSPSPGIRHTAARPTWQGIYLLQGVSIYELYFVETHCMYYIHIMLCTHLRHTAKMQVLCSMKLMTYLQRGNFYLLSKF